MDRRIGGSRGESEEVVSGRFSIETESLNAELLRSRMVHLAAGAFSVFEGRVRNHNEGKEVLALEYEAHLSLAETEGRKILGETLQKFDILEVHCSHRVGRLSLGELAIWVGVLSKHRLEAFRACEYVVDEVKHRVPIWKKEHYADGRAEWVNCAGCARS